MGCKKCNEQNDYNPCNPNPCQEPQTCDCPTILKSDCVIYSGNDLECSGIPTGTILTELIEQQDAFICESLSNIPQTTLKNIGAGAKVYKGDDLLGRKELRTIKSTDNSVIVTESTNEIDLSVTTPCITSVDGSVGVTSIIPTNLVVNGDFDTDLSGWSASMYLNWVWDNGKAKYIGQDERGSLKQGILEVGKTYRIILDFYRDESLCEEFHNITISAGTSQQTFTTGGRIDTQMVAVGDGNFIISGYDACGIACDCITVDNIQVYEVVTEGGCTDLSIDLLGNTPPCIVSTKGSVTISTTPEGCISLDVTTYNGAETKVTAGANVTVSGIGTVSNPYIINSAISTLQDGITTDVIGNGTSTPYSVEVINLQKIISTFPYTLTSLDDKYTIFVSNDVSNVTINVPNSLVPNFSCVFIQEGSGEVTIQSTGTATVIQPIALENKIKGQNYWAMLEKKLSTNTYYLMGSLKTV